MESFKNMKGPELSAVKYLETPVKAMLYTRSLVKSLASCSFVFFNIY